MPRPPLRPAAPAVAAVLAVLSLLTACAAAGGAERDSRPTAHRGPDAPSTEVRAGVRTVVERRLPGGSMFVEVVEGPGGVRARSWVEATDGSTPGELVLLEEVRIGTDHWVHLAMTEHEGITEPAWIHVELSDPRQRDWLEANPVGLLDERALWSVRVGDPLDGDEVVAIEQPSATERVVHLAGGADVVVTRVALSAEPTIDPPDSLPVLPLREVDRLLRR